MTLVVTLGMLVVVPLGLRLLPVVGTDQAARLYPVFAVPGVVVAIGVGGMVGGFLMIRYWRGQAPFGRR